MAVLHPLSEFINRNNSPIDLDANYWYEGRCPQTGELLKLPRTPLVEAIAFGLMQHLAKDDCYSYEGKMYGVLLVELPDGERGVLKAFSGLLQGQSIVSGWVPPIPGRDEIALAEARTLSELEAIKQEIITLKQLPERQQYETLFREFDLGWQEMCDRHCNDKQKRQEKRQILSQHFTGEALTIALEQLNEQSRLEGIERRQFKRQRDAKLREIQQLITQADVRISELKRRRKELSRQLQTQMHAVYSLTNFSGQSLSLQELIPGGSIPTGTGDCCAPKLLHYAATHNLKPLAMAEFWWGLPSINGDKVPGEFYGACGERCQPIMGFLLSGLSPKKSIAPIILTEQTLPIIYEDEWLIAVNKPAGLLSVPGRYRDRQDSVLSRLRHLFPDGMKLMTVHRLDRETSGILLLSRDLETYRQLSEEFQQRRVDKVYEALLSEKPGFCDNFGILTRFIQETRFPKGMIELPLWGDPENRPYQKVNWQHGKPSVTRFQVIARSGNYTRVEFFPLTGRTHQIRVHAADARGLGVPILGDRLYGCCADVSRLHLHAREISFQHSQLGKKLHLQTETPF